MSFGNDGGSDKHRNKCSYVPTSVRIVVVIDGSGCRGE